MQLVILFFKTSIIDPAIKQEIPNGIQNKRRYISPNPVSSKIFILGKKPKVKDSTHDEIIIVDKNPFMDGRGMEIFPQDYG